MVERRQRRLRSAGDRARAPGPHPACRCSAARHRSGSRHEQHRREIEALAPSSDPWPARSRGTRRGRSSRSSVRKPSVAISSRTSSAMNLKKFCTNSGLPLKVLRSSGSCVAMPTGQVLRWQTRIITQPITTSGAVAKPNSSAPSSAATTTSRPVFIWPSTCTTMRSRRLFMSRTCCVSASPSSHGTPACFRLVSGDAPVPPS